VILAPCFYCLVIIGAQKSVWLGEAGGVNPGIDGRIGCRKCYNSQEELYTKSRITRGTSRTPEWIPG
jgi:hypothetical protein